MTIVKLIHAPVRLEKLSRTTELHVLKMEVTSALLTDVVTFTTELISNLAPKIPKLRTKLRIFALRMSVIASTEKLYLIPNALLIQVTSVYSNDVTISIITKVLPARLKIPL